MIVKRETQILATEANFTGDYWRDLHYSSPYLWELGLQKRPAEGHLLLVWHGENACLCQWIK